MSSSKGRNIIVVGASAGGLEALDALISLLPGDLPASIFIVQHMSAQNTGQPLVDRLSRRQSFPCKLAEDGERFRERCIYIAPPDNHLLVKERNLLVTKGARENRYRPAIDPLFRSAAVTHRSRVIGVVLSGMLDDGTAGLMAIQKCGGVSVVQDPKEAAYPDMPLNALNNMGWTTVCPLPGSPVCWLNLRRSNRERASPYRTTSALKRRLRSGC